MVLRWCSPLGSAKPSRSSVKRQSEPLYREIAHSDLLEAYYPGWRSGTVSILTVLNVRAARESRQ